MDDLLREFLTETSESLDTVDNQLVRFEQDPSDAKILDNIFRLVHTIKGTCGFLGLPRLEALAHAGETLMGKFRDGMPVKAEAVTLILSSIDRIKEILAGLEATETEPEGTDEDLIEKLHAMAEGGQPCRGRAGCRARPRGRRTAGAARDHPGSCQGHADRSGAGAPAASRRSLARRPRTRLPRDRDRSCAQTRAGPRRQAGRARAAKPACRANRQAAKEAAKEAARQSPPSAPLSPTPPMSRKPTRSPTSRSASTWTRWNT